MTVEASTKNARLYYSTRSLCPECNELVPGKIVNRGGKVLVSRTCPEHGDFEGLVCSDDAWWEQLPRFYVEGVKPREPGRQSERGCPDDCGLCPQHQQIAGTAAVEVSNVCDNDCPTCLADNQETFSLTVDEVVAALDRVLKHQDYVDVFTLSGGEPTLHPELFEIIAALQRPEVGRICINSNGIRISEDDAFLDRLAAQDNVYVCLHYDGEGAKALRGVEHAVQQRAFERLCERGIDVVPLILATKDVNDGELGPILARMLERSAKIPSIKSVMLSMMTYAGRNGTAFAGDPETRLTIPEALDRIEETSGGVLHRRDFMPLTMPNPMCATIGYFMVMDDTITPLIPLADIDRVIAMTKNGSFGQVNDEFEQFLKETIDAIYADPDRFDDGPAMLARFRRLMEDLFPAERTLSRAERLKAAERHIKSVYLMQFMDAWTFDSHRLTKCSCQHVLPDDKVVASCGYYAYHRGLDARFA